MGRIAVPPTYGTVIALLGMLGIPSNFFVIALVYNQTAWITGIQATGFSEAVFFWAVIHLVISVYLVGAGLKQIVDSDMPKKCKECKQIQCVCEN